MRYCDLSLVEKRGIRKKLLRALAKQGMTVREADEKIAEMTLDEKLKLIEESEEKGE